uniref:Uncharacterized protein n=1 Tax=Octopus bimaculoides TaxID=37653 RepID=A0A0L8FXL6_OCTBM
MVEMSRCIVNESKFNKQSHQPVQLQELKYKLKGLKHHPIATNVNTVWSVVKIKRMSN